MNHKFKYIYSGKYHRPIIPVTLKRGKHKANYLALVDSGADICVVHTGVATLLNIDLTNIPPEPLSGVVGKPGKMYKQVVDIGVNNEFHPTAIYFSSDLSHSGYAFLGQIGFFDRFKSINFNKNSGKILIKG